jgi:hypothetical protein
MRMRAASISVTGTRVLVGLAMATQWLSRSNGSAGKAVSAPVEMDFYAGFKKELLHQGLHLILEFFNTTTQRICHSVLQLPTELLAEQIQIPQNCTLRKTLHLVH